MQELVSADSDKAVVLKYLNLEAVLKVLRQYLDSTHSSSVETKVAALSWIHRLFTRLQTEVSQQYTNTNTTHIFQILFTYFLFTSDVSICNESVPWFVENLIGWIGWGSFPGFGGAGRNCWLNTFKWFVTFHFVYFGHNNKGVDLF